jgi:hypothetical protein
LLLIIDNKWMDDGLGSSFGALRNLGKPYFLQFSANIIRDINAQHDKNWNFICKKNNNLIWNVIEIRWSINSFTPHGRRPFFSKKHLTSAIFSSRSPNEIKNYFFAFLTIRSCPRLLGKHVQKVSKKLTSRIMRL